MIPFDDCRGGYIGNQWVPWRTDVVWPDGRYGVMVPNDVEVPDV